MALAFRLAEPPDYAALEKLTIESFEPITWLRKVDERFGPLNGRDWRERWRARFQHAFNTQRVLVGEAEGEAGGFCQRHPRQPRRGWALSTCWQLTSRFQGRGYGREMLRGMLAYFKKRRRRTRPPGMPGRQREWATRCTAPRALRTWPNRCTGSSAFPETQAARTYLPEPLASCGARPIIEPTGSFGSLFSGVERASSRRGMACPENLGREVAMTASRKYYSLLSYRSRPRHRSYRMYHRTPTAAAGHPSLLLGRSAGDV